MATAPIPDSSSRDLPSPPFVPIEGIHNFRDAGGYAVQDSTTSSVRRAYVYRCADPCRVTPAGQAALQARRVRAIFDLRSGPEIRKAVLGTFPDVEGIARHETPCFADQDYSPEAIAERYRDYATGGVDGFVRAYADILAYAGPSFRTILLHVRDCPDAPFVVHCSAGKDRTGVITAILLSLAGASDDTIAREYALTEQGLGPLREVIRRHLLESPALGGDRDKADRMTASEKSYMVAALQMIRDTYGGVEGYVKAKCGLSDADIQTIRANLRSDDVKPVL